MAKRRRIAQIAIALGAAYAVLLVGLWAGQRHLIYFPNTRTPPPVAEFLPTGSDLTLHTADGLDLDAWWVTPTGPDRHQAVLFAPGNGGNRGGRTIFAQLLADRGFHVLLMDYRGYGGNPGRPSSDGLRLDALAAQAALVEQGFGPQDTIYFGESLGTGVVSRLATEVPPAAIVLRSPFTSLADTAAHQFRVVPAPLIDAILRDHYYVQRYLSTIDVPVTVIYGTADSVVPTNQSATVADTAGNLFERVEIPGADHNDAVMFSPEVADAVVRLADSVARH